MNVKVSAIIPVYNGEKFVHHAVTHIYNQNSFGLEIIVVDDGSHDNSADLLKENFGDKIVLLKKNNGGAGSAVSRGLGVATGEYIAFCDQDDWWLPNKLEKQVKYLDEHKDIDLVYSDAYIGTEDGQITQKTWMQRRGVFPCEGGYKECAASLFKRNFICAPLVVMVRRSALDAIGGIDGKYTSAYDYDLWFRLLESGSKFGYINEPLAVWRAHSQNESRNIRKAKKLQFLILTAFLERNPRFIIRHPASVLFKYLRMFLGDLVEFNPYRS